MAENKKNEKKVKTVPSPVKKQPQAVAREKKYRAIELAKIYNVSDFQFLALKRAEDINESSFITMTEFLEILKKHNIKR